MSHFTFHFGEYKRKASAKVFLLNGFVGNLTVKIIRETDLSDLSDSWRSNISAIFSDKTDKSVSFFSRRIHVNLT
jgi:hypothetical protein